MKKLITTIALASILTSAACAGSVDVAAFYYPGWRGAAKQGSEKRRDEWNFVKTARPRFGGHMQPKTPYLGYLDSSDPKDVALEIGLAAANGIDVFIYPLRWNGGKPHMPEALENGFLKAENRQKIKFALVWENQDVLDVFRPAFGKPRKTIFKRTLSEGELLKAIDYCIVHCFSQPNYWKVGGKIYLGVCEPEKFAKELGGAEGVKKIFSKIDEKMRRAGLPPIHWAANAACKDGAKIFARAGFSSVFSRRAAPSFAGECGEKISAVEYSELTAAAEKIWRGLEASPLPFIPTASQGFDSTPLCKQNVKFPYERVEYPYAPVIINNSSDKFEKHFARAVQAAQGKNALGAVFVDSWNDWLNGAAVFPERIEGMNYLRAISRICRPSQTELVYATAHDKKKLFAMPQPDCRLKYAEYGKNAIDFWRAQNSASKNAPTVVYIHGGGWSNNSSLDNRLRVLFELRKKGFNIAAVSYRLVQEAADVFPPVKAPMQDCANALALLVENAEKLNIDTSRITLAGGSAGACTSLWLALNAGKKLDSGRVIPPVKMISVVVPQTTLDPKLMLEWIPNSNYGAHAFRAGSFKNFLEKRGELLEEINKYSPYSLLSPEKKHTKLFLIARENQQVGEPAKDPTHGSAFCIKFKEKCDALGVPCQTIFDKRDWLAAMRAIQEYL